MRLVRFEIKGQLRYGILEGDRVRETLRPYVEGIMPMQTVHALADLRLLAPVRPSKMLCIGINYRDHAREMGHTMPDEPVLFMKPASALAGPGHPIAWTTRPSWPSSSAAARAMSRSRRPPQASWAIHASMT
jgi:2-keto-4-pentenoate hydratase/2-oxohepta-3-ene-1,7-dioic acid hydratase in catechol pathway